MKPNIHPQYFTDTIVTCSCGNTFTTGSTKQQIHIEVCHQCHPLYTGKKGYIDTLGQVEKFQQKQKRGVSYQEKLALKKTKKTDKEERRPKSLRELLMEI